MGLGATVSAQKILTSRYSFLFFALAGLLGGVPSAKAQVDPNIQSRIQIYTLPLTATTAETQQVTTNFGACLSDPQFILMLAHHGGLQLPPDLKKHDTNRYDDSRNPLFGILAEKQNKQRAADILAQYFLNKENVKKAHEVVSNFLAQASNSTPIQRGRLRPFFLPPTGIPFCATQSVTVKLSAPFNPTNESNVLKSSQNNSHGTSWGYGGAAQMVVPAPASFARPFDVVGFSAQSQSVRYNQYPLKSLDSLIFQGAYQFYLGASGYDTNGSPTGPITPASPPTGIPPNNMITVDSVAFGFQNQTAFVPAFHAETVNLFTPQITFNRQNQDLSFAGQSCFTAIPDPRKQGFCYYADFSLTAGQTLSDVSTQENANITASATPGWRIPDSDWKLTLPMTATARSYENVTGGRRDLLLQIGSALNYTPPPFYDRIGDTYVASLSISATYNQNYSSVVADAWRGYIIMPTLTIAYQPPTK
jgi:hypothetical protein